MTPAARPSLPVTSLAVPVGSGGGAAADRPLDAPGAGRPRDGGYVTVFTLGAAMALVSVVGLVLDGGRAQRAQSDAFGAAAAASRAGAQQLDPVAAVAGAVRLDPGRAEEAVRSHLAPLGLSGSVTVTDTQVTVTVTRHVDYLVLPGGTDLDATATTRITQERAP